MFKKLFSRALQQSGTHSQTSAIDIESMIPELKDIFIGDGDFKIIGNHFFQLFKNKGRLQPHHRVLDMGCGQGRMAIPLIGYLNSQGSYEGFDIVEHGIAWCQDKISRNYPRFHFQHGDIYNKMYNPGGQLDEATFSFPYSADEFDFIFLTSVFTHLRPAPIRNYLREITRVLKPDGRCLFTTFILDEVGRYYGEKDISKINFAHAINGFWTCDPETPEAAIAYPHLFWVEEIKNSGLTIAEPVELGHWRYAKTYTPGFGQDIFVVTPAK